MQHLSLVLIVVACLVSSCAPAAPAAPPTAAPKPTTAAPAAAPTQVAPKPTAAAPAAATTQAAPKPTSPAPAAAPAAPKPTTAAAAAKPADWEQLVEPARREGQVAVAGPPGPESRAVLADAFQKKFDIRVEFLGAAPRDLATRITTERTAGQYLWDVYIGGSTSAITSLIPIGSFVPLGPALVMPEVRDAANWRDGLAYADTNGQLLAMTARQREVLFVNKNMVNAQEFTSYKDLLDPKWKGKIVMDDPRNAGPGQTTFTFFLLHPELGEDFIRALAKQEPVMLRDFRQEADAVGQGRFPILIGTDVTVVEPLVDEGAPIAIVDPRQIREGSDTSSGNGNLAIFDKAPHPNAAKLYANWVLTREAQDAYVRAVGYISNRADVATDFTYPWRVPKAGAIRTWDAQAIAVRDRLVPLLTEVFGPA